ncbi:MAG: hypothetical protein CMH46_00500 [Muricauda sp.]|nr:hypothetical protein [Allomuricauda sp.]MAU14003.1 hypothetical protein [Allomuricauda sp.]
MPKVKGKCICCGDITTRHFSCEENDEDIFLCNKYCIYDTSNHEFVAYDKGVSQVDCASHEHYKLVNQTTLHTIKCGVRLIISILRKELNKVCGKGTGDALNELQDVISEAYELRWNVRYRDSGYRKGVFYYIPDMESWFQAVKTKFHEIMEERAMKIALCFSLPTSYRERKRSSTLTNSLKGYKFIPFVKRTFIPSLPAVLRQLIWQFAFDDYKNLSYYDGYRHYKFMSNYPKLKPGKEMQGLLYQQVQLIMEKKSKTSYLTNRTQRALMQSVRNKTRVQLQHALMSKYTLKSKSTAIDTCPPL